MKKRLIAIALVLCLAAAAWGACAENSGTNWARETRETLRVGNPTALRGRFFTTMWGGTTSDLDVQDLLHGYAPARYDIDETQFRFDNSVVQDATIVDDPEGNRTYYIVLYDDLKWSDGTPITAKDYAFSILFRMDPAIAETGGRPADYSWISGAEAYLNKEKTTLSGLRIVGENILEITVLAEALPYFYELSRFMFHPYPAAVLAPGIEAKDDGEGAYLSGTLTAEMITETVLDPKHGYLTHPVLVSGPYMLTAFDGVTAKFTINPYYKGNEKALVPRIGELEYTLADNADMITKLDNGEFGLLNKVTLSDSILEGLHEGAAFAADLANYRRVGLTMIWFMESSFAAQDPAVRKAIAYSFDRDSFTTEYAGPFGLKMDAFCGIGQWMYQLATGIIGAPVDEDMTEEEKAAEEERFSELTLDAVTKYSPDKGEAIRGLEEAGWKLNGKGVRSRKTGGEEKELRLVLGMPESPEAKEALEWCLTDPLKDIGIPVDIRTLSMEELEKEYRGETARCDLLYLGEDFSIFLDPKLLKPQKEPLPEDNLSAGKAELYEQAREMVRDEPDDFYGFLKKWIGLQEQIMLKLPLLPVYSNIYFDFYTRELYDYEIIEAVTWGEAIVGSYLSDPEDLNEIDKKTIREKLEEMERQFEQVVKHRPVRQTH